MNEEQAAYRLLKIIVAFGKQHNLDPETMTNVLARLFGMRGASMISTIRETAELDAEKDLEGISWQFELFDGSYVLVDVTLSDKDFSEVVH